MKKGTTVCILNILNIQKVYMLLDKIVDEVIKMLFIKRQSLC